jgi:hypothetical protein
MQEAIMLFIWRMKSEHIAVYNTKFNGRKRYIYILYTLYTLPSTKIGEGQMYSSDPWEVYYITAQMTSW